MLSLIEKIYEFEHEAKDYIELQKIRSEQSRVIVEDMNQWMQQQSGRYLVNSAIGKAISYATGNWERFIRFLDNVRIPIDNNARERSQRRPVMGRNNFLGFRTINGADTGMFFYTIIASCRLIGVNAKAYMLEMAGRSLKGENVISPYKFALEIEGEIRKCLAGKYQQEAFSN